ncbi:hypothetical protein Aksp02_02512 [Akkermansia sp. NBRC 115031]
MYKSVAGIKVHSLFISRGYFCKEMAEALLHIILFQMA